ncbi:hypothetical protein Patl1_05707 [Pistacia atlantica]|uniref:Uncharacterized protein n=1 Tax=Pistacia atlantica TaxID=434234 RepID=A0ACC1BQB6_9ROSI|nr:hypothetical protein Patl1_05707 [Pistacia atlantica]
MLGNLQVLKVNRCGQLKKLPKDIIKLVNLRCLEVGGCYNLVGMPRGLRQLTSLQSLSCFKLGEKDGDFADLNELNQLIINLRGGLAIEELQNATSKPTLSNLKAAQHIQSLEFYWTAFGFGESQYDDLVLESLEPHQNLKYLVIDGFQGMRIPNWLSTLRNLIGIQITHCYYCRHLPALDQLPSLKRLSLLTAVEYISDASYTMSMSFFPSLEELEILTCTNLKGWWRRDDGDIMQLKDLPAFPCLSNLYIDDCPNLTSMPLCSSLEDLTIYGSSLKPLEKMMSNVPSSTPSISAGLLSRLKSLRISYPDTLDLLTEEYDKQWEALTSLRSVELSVLHELVSLPKGFQRVTSLQSLKIWFCDNLTVLTEGMHLQYLEIKECPQLLEKWWKQYGC